MTLAFTKDQPVKFKMMGREEKYHGHFVLYSRVNNAACYVRNAKGFSHYVLIADVEAIENE